MKKKNAAVRRQRLEAFNAVLDDLEGGEQPLCPSDPGEVDSLIEGAEDWAAWGASHPPGSESPPLESWKTSVFPPLIRAISIQLERIGVHMADYRTASDCLHPPTLVDRVYPCRLLFDMLLKCYLARDPWTLDAQSIRELRAQLMELGFAMYSGAVFKANKLLKAAAAEEAKAQQSIKNRRDQQDKEIFQNWIREKGIRIERISDFAAMKACDVPEDVLPILERSRDALRRWYKEIHPEKLKGGAPRKEKIYGATPST